MPHLRNYHQIPLTTLKEQQTTKNGEKNLIVEPNGNQYIGEWKDNMKHGHGVQIWRGRDKWLYNGNWVNGERHGYGTISLYDHERKRYECIYGGDWVNGERNGWGICRYPGGAQYEGNWECNERHGAGRMWYPDGSTYRGLWQNDQRWSAGHMICADGVEYVGSWKDDKRHGFGIFDEKEQRWFEGDWRNNEKHGVGQCFYYDSMLRAQGLWLHDGFCCGTLADLNDEDDQQKAHPIPECNLVDADKVIDEGMNYHIENECKPRSTKQRRSQSTTADLMKNRGIEFF